MSVAKGIGVRAVAVPALRGSAQPRWLADAWPRLAIVVLALAGLLPLYQHGWPNATDIDNHLMRLVALDQQVRAGVLLPRWTPELALGYGYPLFNFYAPGLYYLAEAFHLLGLPFDTAWTATATTLALTAGLGMYQLALAVFASAPAGPRRWAALLAAAAYLYAPYWSIDLYLRGALPELAGLALLPWLLAAFRALLTASAPRAHWLAAAGCLGLLAVTHTISLVLALPMLAAYALALAWQARQPARLAWAGLAALAGAALSLGVWLPVLVERAYLSPAAVESALSYLRASAYEWHALVDLSLRYRYSYQQPPPLGLAQVGLGVAGWLAGWSGRRRSAAEWVFWGGLALAVGLSMTQWAQPLWTSTRALAAVQFVWRQLGPLSLVLALAAGGLALGLARVTPRALPVAAAALVGLMAAAGFPRLPASLGLLLQDGTALRLPELARYELVSNDLGATSNWRGVASDFMPRWVDQSHHLTQPARAEDHLSTEDLALTLQQAGPYGWAGTVQSPSPRPVRFASFYFPGWRFTLDGRPAAAPYASGTRGLLTVDVPAGTHTFRLVWAGTSLERSALLVSLAALAGFAVEAAWGARQRGLALLALGGLGLGLVAAARPASPLGPLAAPAAPVRAAGLELLGVRAQLSPPHTVLVFPYWLVRRPPADLQARWQLLDHAGQPVAETTTRPFYDSLPATSWPSGLVVDDAYQLALPAGLPAGDYPLRLCLQTAPFTEAGCGPAQTFLAGVVTLPAATSAPTPVAPARAVSFHFGDQAALTGYTLRVNGRLAPVDAPFVPVRRGDTLAYTLYWRALPALRWDLNGVLELLGPGETSLLKQEAVLGPEYLPPRRWDPFYTQPDTYRFRVPRVPASQVAWLALGVSAPDAGPLPAVETETSAALGPRVTLSGLKLMAPAAAPPAPQHRLSARFMGLARLAGYDLALPASGLRAGETFTLTVYYQAEGASLANLTQFVHLYDPARGLAAQADRLPQAGANPTTAWQPGEWVVDTLPMTISPQAAAGTYDLWLGFYDLAADLTRVPVTDAAGQPLPNGQVLLNQLTLLP